MTNPEPTVYIAIWDYIFETSVGGEEGAIEAVKQAEAILSRNPSVEEGTSVMIVQNRFMEVQWFFEMEGEEPRLLFTLGVQPKDMSNAADPNRGDHQFVVSFEKVFTFVTHEDIGRTEFVCAQMAAAALWNAIRTGTFELPVAVTELLGETVRNYSVVADYIIHEH